LPSPKPKPYKYKILLTPTEEYIEKVATPIYSTLAWRQAALSRMKMWMFFQVKKSLIYVKRRGSRAKISRGYGVPRQLEYICPRFSVVAVPPTPEESRIYRAYWMRCYEKSKEIYWWLQTVEPSAYNRDLHWFLKSIIVAPFPVIQEAERYGKSLSLQNGIPDPDRPLHF